jgi:hypothetical protein
MNLLVQIGNAVSDATQNARPPEAPCATYAQMATRNNPNVRPGLPQNTNQLPVGYHRERCVALNATSKPPLIPEVVEALAECSKEKAQVSCY